MPTIYLALLIPLIVTGIFYYFKRHEFVWWEFFVPFGATLVFIIISKLIIDYTAVQFTEYWGSTVTSVVEEEPWNEWVHKTCSHTTRVGKTSITTYYDCSYQSDHGPQWYAKTNLGESFDITEKQHDELVKQFGTKRTSINSRHNYAPRDEGHGCDGTKFANRRVGNTSYTYQTSWDGTDATRKAYTSEHSYENKIKASDLTIFNISLVNKAKADSMGLFDYPEHQSGGFFSMTNGLDYPTILGGKVSEAVQEKFRKLNGKFGVSNQMRLWVLVFENKPSMIAQYQENYWVRGNMNELVVCIGVKGNEIQWSHAFSWAKSDELTAAVKNAVINLYTYRDTVVKKGSPVIPVTDKLKKTLGGVGKNLPNVLPIGNQEKYDTLKIKSTYPMLTDKTWDDLSLYLNKNLGRFERRSFKEFDYLTVEPSKGAIIFVYILALIISLAVNFWVVSNEIYDNDGEKKCRW